MRQTALPKINDAISCVGDLFGLFRSVWRNQTHETAEKILVTDREPSIALSRRVQNILCKNVLLFLGFAALGTVLFTSQAQGPEQILPDIEWEKRQDILQRMEPLGDDLLGDVIDPHTGSISFQATDVSLPGNSNLEVAIKRRRNPGEVHADNLRVGFGDWQLSVPHLKVELLSSGWANNRCTGNPGDVYPSIDTNPYTINLPTYPMEYSNGLQLTSPEGGGNLVWLGTSQSAVYGADVRYATDDHWKFTCISDIGATNGGGEGFIGIAPNGNQYRFDRLIERSGAVMGSFFTIVHSSRITAYLMATEVKDVNGNTVNYNYDALNRLTDITSSDGRVITLTYFTPDGTSSDPEKNGASLIKEVEANGRVWTYAYGDAAYKEDTLEDVIRPNSLKTVTLPNNRTWTYELGGMSVNTYPTSICRQRNQVLKVTHPYGIRGEFETKETNHRLTLNRYQGDLGRGCDPIGVSSPNSRPEIPDHSEIMSVIRKELIASDGTRRGWGFAYEQDVSGDATFPNPPGDHTNWTVVVDPAGVTKKYYHYWDDEPLGGELKRLEISKGGVTLETTEYVHERGPTYFGTDYLTAPLQVPADVTRHFDVVEKQTTITRDSDTFATINEFDMDRASPTFSFGRPTKIDTSSSLHTRIRSTVIEYDHDKTNWVLGLTTKVTRNGKVFGEYLYDTLGRLEQVKMFGTVMQDITYDAEGNVHTVTDAIGNQWAATNWKRGFPQTVDRPDNTQFNRVVSDDGWVMSETDARNNETQFDYNTVGWLESVDLPGDYWADISIGYNYVAGGIVQTLTRGDFETTITYDEYNRPVLERKRDLGGAAADIYIATAYDGLGRVEFTSFPSDAASPVDGIETDYDGLGRIEETRRMVGGSVLSRTRTDFLAGNQIQVTDPRNFVTTTTFESFGAPIDDPSADDAQPVLIVPPTGASTEIDYDIWGNPTHERQVLGASTLAETVTAYNLKLLPASVTDPAGDVTYTYYNDKNLPIVELDGEGRATRMTYDPMDRVEKVIKAWTGTNDGTGELNCATMLSNYSLATGYLQQCYQHNQYDANGNLEQISDARGNITTYTYNSLDLPVRTTFPDASYTEVQAYDPLGNPQTTRTRAGEIHNYAHDAFSRMIAMRTPDRDSAYAYDAQDLRTCASVYASGSLNLTGSIDCENTSVGRLHRTLYAFDAAGRMLSETALETGYTALATSYLYDAADNRTRITWPDSYYVQYNYDALARLTDILENGSAMLAHYDYDAQSRLDIITHGGDNFAGGSGASQTDFTWEIDNDLAGLSYAFAASPDVAFTYGYDKSGKLTSESFSLSNWTYVPESPSYDAYDAVNALNQYTSVNSVTVSHDLNGNRIEFDGLSTPHDSENRLIGASATGVSVSYSYDADGRRVRKTVGSSHTRFAHAGDMEIAEYNGNTLERRFVPGHSVDMRAAMIDEPSGTIHYYHANRLGSVQAVVSAAGAVADQYIYTPFGVEIPLDMTGNPFRYTGRRFDPETKLYYYRARYYDPQHGRFLQTDPIGYQDQMNLYAYVHNDPLNGTDPTGQFCVNCITGAIGGAVGLVVGGGTQIVGDAVTGKGFRPGHVAGAAAGGLVTGGVIGATGQVGVGFAAGGATQSVTTQLLTGNDLSATEIVVDTAVSATVGKVVPGVKVPGITSGNGSMAHVAKTQTTRLAKGQISSVAPKTVGKAIVSSGVGSSGQNIATGIAGDIKTGTIEAANNLGNAVSSGANAIGNAAGSLANSIPQNPINDCNTTGPC